ncbi:MAG: hypothetical protein ACKOX2_07900, partial [Microcystaceae cyanobacterium]
MTPHEIAQPIIVEYHKALKVNDDKGKLRHDFILSLVTSCSSLLSIGFSESKQAIEELRIIVSKSSQSLFPQFSLSGK